MFEVLRTCLRTSKISWVEFVKESAYKNRRYARFCSCSTLLCVILSAFNAFFNEVEPHMNFLMLSNSLQEVSDEKQENPLTHLCFLQNLNFNGTHGEKPLIGQTIYINSSSQELGEEEKTAFSSSREEPKPSRKFLIKNCIKLGSGDVNIKVLPKFQTRVDLIGSEIRKSSGAKYSVCLDKLKVALICNPSGLLNPWGRS
ncbi:unnamed protein product [Citrullus colocynthis]|uniref:Uncharacterized protein n=1 Tax=Citrullus colocynthis TaxID=252529 RepID=A0ABP0YX65_9ROSI